MTADHGLHHLYLNHSLWNKRDTRVPVFNTKQEISCDCDNCMLQQGNRNNKKVHTGLNNTDMFVYLYKVINLFFNMTDVNAESY